MSTRVFLVFLFSVALSVALSGCGGPDDTSAPATDPSVAGCITELYTGGPVPDAAVMLIDPGTLLPRSPVVPTDAQGDYALYGVAAGTYQGVVFHDSMAVFDRSSGTITVVEGSTASWNARIQSAELWHAPPYRIEGTVRDADTLEGLSGAHVTLAFWSTQDVLAYLAGVAGPWMAVSDGHGHYSIGGVLAVDYSGHDIGLFPVTVACPGYESATVAGPGTGSGLDIEFLPVPAEGDSVLRTDVLLRKRSSESPSGSLTGRVTFLGRPVPGLPVALSIDTVADPDTVQFTHTVCTPLAGQTTTTDQGGAFLFTDLTPGTYTVYPAYRLDDGYHGYGHVEYEQQVTDGDTLDAGAIPVELAINCTWPADGAVVDTRTPTLRWQAVPDTLDHELLRYELHLAVDRYYADSTIEVGSDPEWRPPAEAGFAAGAHVKWWVEAWAVNEAGGDTTRMAAVERFSAFEVGD